MIRIKEVKADLSFNVDFVNISFSIENTVEDVSRYRFDLFRADNENDIFTPVVFDMKNFEFNDYSANLLNGEMMHFYKIQITNLNTNEKNFSEIFSPPNAPSDEYTYYLSNIYETYLNDVINNRDMYVLKRKRSGELCECYDDVRGSRKSDRCEKCFGTGFKGGFFPPVEIKVNFANSASVTETLDPKGSFQATSQVQLWTTGYPLIQENDIILDSMTKEKATVVSWQPSYKNGFLLRQTIVIDKIPESSLLYKIPMMGVK